MMSNIDDFTISSKRIASLNAEYAALHGLFAVFKKNKLRKQIDELNKELEELK